MAYIFHDMELADEDKLDCTIPCASDKPMLPQFPWGLRISLTERELETLDLDPAGAQVGGMVHGHFMARITSASIDQNQDGKTRHRIELQIEQMCVESEDEENAEAEKKPARRSLYG